MKIKQPCLILHESSVWTAKASDRRAPLFSRVKNEEEDIRFFAGKAELPSRRQCAAYGQPDRQDYILGNSPIYEVSGVLPKQVGRMITLLGHSVFQDQCKIHVKERK